MNITTPIFPSKSGHERFLYASVCEQRNGTQLSVLSALTRASLDPWTEAGRLAAMPGAEAEQALLAILDRVCGEELTPSERTAAAGRLTDLLHADHSDRVRMSTATKPDAERRVFLILWLGFVMGMMIFSSDNRTKTTGPSVSTPASKHILLSRNGITSQPKAD